VAGNAMRRRHRQENIGIASRDDPRKARRQLLGVIDERSLLNGSGGQAGGTRRRIRRSNPIKVSILNEITGNWSGVRIEGRS
jgi:hypothetical protein